MNDNFATKSDLEKLGWTMQSEMKAVETRLETNIQKLDSRITEMEYKLTIKLGSMMVISTTLLGVLIKLIPSTNH